MADDTQTTTPADSAAPAAMKSSSDEVKRRRGKLRHKPSRRTRENLAKAPAEALDPIDAINAIKGFKAPKFDQSVEVCLFLGVDPRHADQLVRGSVSLPKGIGKSKRVVAFCDDAIVDEATAAGAVEAGGASLVKKIEGGWMDFDVAVASPDMMRVISKLGRTLGPKGLMPSPKAGTVTKNVAEAVKEYAAGKVEYRTDKAGNVHAIIGKMSFPAADLLENYEHFVKTIEDARPSAAKGQYVKKVAISGTMTPGVEVTYTSAEAEA
ncbi:MAG: 50S ribosomal protein L1 [Planctomycetota bacterium]